MLISCVCALCQYWCVSVPYANIDVCLFLVLKWCLCFVPISMCLCLVPTKLYWRDLHACMPCTNIDLSVPCANVNECHILVPTKLYWRDQYACLPCTNIDVSVSCANATVLMSLWLVPIFMSVWPCTNNDVCRYPVPILMYLCPVLVSILYWYACALR